MTIARDHTGAVVGQVLDERRERLYPLATGGPTWRHIVKLLTRDGRYVTVPASSVRLEELR